MPVNPPKKNRTRIAVDPGASGGIAWWNPVNGDVKAVKMPDTEGDIVILLKDILAASPDGAIVHMEVVGGFIRGNPAPGSTMFNFGRGYGFLLGVFAAWNIPVHSIRPQVWQAGLGVGTKGTLNTTQWKNKLKAKAQQYYPSMGVTLSTADALLILDYAVRLNP